MFDQEALDTCPLDVLSEGIAQLCAMKARTERILLAYVAAYERREGYRVDGARSMPEWLAGVAGCTHAHAAEMTRAARRLDDLPAIADAYEEGRLSWDQVRALVHFATPHNDALLAADAPGLTLAQLRGAARKAKVVTDEEAAEAHRRRGLRWWVDDEHSWVHIAGRLTPDEGATVVGAHEAAAETAGPDPDTGVWAPHESRLADALVDLVGAGAATGGCDAPRATVVVHVDAAALAGDGPGGAEIVSPVDAPISVETARRLTCDAQLEACIDDPHGRPLGVGRRRRTVPAWLARQVRRRDRSCRFPGCGSTRLLHNHHIMHWAHGGPTDLDNLLTTCGLIHAPCSV